MKARIVIIGGGIIGLSLAYFLGKRGITDVIVLEKSHLNAGATARCGGGIRQQWTSAANIEITKESVEHFRKFSLETGFNIWFRQDGYLFLAYDESQAGMMVESVKLQNGFGVPTRLLSPREVKRLAPELNPSSIQCGAYNPTDGTIFPMAVVWGYMSACKAMGIQIMPHTPCECIDTKNGAVYRVRTPTETIESGAVVNAAGSWSPSIAEMVGVKLPNYPEKHEIIVTEPVNAFLGPNLVPMDSGMFVSQTIRGEVLACVGMVKGPASEINATFAYIQKISGLLISLMPRLADVRVLRHWAGYYDITPDTNPIVGPVPGVEGFIQHHGYMGHGFMFAPAVSRRLADYIAGAPMDSVLASWSYDRFEKGLLASESMIIG